jgi:hypothetical protein
MGSKKRDKVLRKAFPTPVINIKELVTHKCSKKELKFEGTAQVQHASPTEPSVTDLVKKRTVI